MDKSYVLDFLSSALPEVETRNSSTVKRKNDSRCDTYVSVCQVLNNTGQIGKFENLKGNGILHALSYFPGQRVVGRRMIRRWYVLFYV